MSNINEEKYGLIVGFIQHVFDEVQTEGWRTRRNEFMLKYNSYFKNEEHPRMDNMTFNKASDMYEDIDETISSFLFPILSNPHWLEAWILYVRPDLEDYVDDGDLWDVFDEILYKPQDGEPGAYKYYMRSFNYDKIKEILGLDLMFK